METALLLGAGSSFVTGLPLTHNLFDTGAATAAQNSTAVL